MMIKSNVMNIKRFEKIQDHIRKYTIHPLLYSKMSYNVISVSCITHKHIAKYNECSVK